MSITHEIRAAIDQRREEVKNVFIDSGFKTYDHLRSRFGAGMELIADAGPADFGAWQAIRPFCTTLATDLDRPLARNFRYVLDGRRLSAKATVWADLLFDDWLAVIRERGDRLQHLQWRPLTDFTYEMVGWRGGRLVRIVQDMVIERSIKGTMLYSFPCRIMVEGRAISVKKYDFLFGEHERLLERSA